MARGGKRPGAGRPKGSPNKATACIREAAQQYTDQAISVLVEVMGSPEHPAAARVSAANALLDRGFGKPRQSLDVDMDAEVTASVRKIERVIIDPAD
jgi:hypothetical protein